MITNRWSEIAAALQRWQRYWSIRVLGLPPGMQRYGYCWYFWTERDDAFRMEIQRLSRRGLYLIGAIFLGLIAFVSPLISLSGLANIDRQEGLAHILVSLILVAAIFAVARSPWGLAYGRIVGLAMIVLASILTFQLDLQVAGSLAEGERYVLADATGALLVAVVTIPALPLQMLLTGLLIAAAYPVCYSFSKWSGVQSEALLIPLTATLVLDAVLCAVLSAITYHRLYTNHWSHQAVLDAQRERLVTDSALSVGRLAAALSHELNNPLGTLKSSVSTLSSVRKRAKTASLDDLPRLDRSARQAEESARQALERMENIVHHMQRFTNLDRAETRQFNLNSLIDDTVALLKTGDGSGQRLEVDAGRVPDLYSKPQSVGAVISTLIQESLEASPEETKVRIATRRDNSRAVVTIHDERPPIPAHDMESLFDPRFQVRGGRVSTGNWSWFNSRQILRELGGDLAVSSEPSGATTTLLLPLRPS